MSNSVPMTPEGYRRLHEELSRLKEVERPAIVKEIGAAREHGDLKENAEYHAAKERQGFVEGRIRDIEDKLSRAEVIDPAKLAGERVAFGARVRLSNVESGEEVTYHIVGPEEADLEEGSISISSPLARALIGREVGDQVRVRAPVGVRVYELLDVEFGIPLPATAAPPGGEPAT